MSKTSDAMAWLAVETIPKRTAHEAARMFGISQSAISQAKAKRSVLSCPSCGAVFQLSDARRGTMPAAATGIWHTAITTTGGNL